MVFKIVKLWACSDTTSCLQLQNNSLHWSQPSNGDDVILQVWGRALTPVHAGTWQLASVLLKTPRKHQVAGLAKPSRQIIQPFTRINLDLKLVSLWMDCNSSINKKSWTDQWQFSPGKHLWEIADNGFGCAYLGSVVALCVVVILCSQLAVCVFIWCYAVIIMLVIVCLAQIQRVW